MTMVETAFDAELNAMRSRIEPLEKLVHAFAGSLPAPLHYHSGQEHYGVRFGKPDVRHFCLLKAVRVVSALNAAITLARGGYTQEIGVLMRILIECTTHIEFVLDCRDEGGVLEPAADKYIKDYFSDFARGPDGGLRGIRIDQVLRGRTFNATAGRPSHR
jgi:hypothetical protein